MFSSFETECPTLVIASLSTWTRIIALQESDQVVEDPTKGASYTTLNFYVLLRPVLQFCSSGDGWSRT